MRKFIFIFLFFNFSFGSLNFTQNESTTKILSRKRRYIIFPEGSSLQLVYCLTMPSLGMGQIFTVGSTAAMAWELPHEPIIFKDKKHKDKPNEIEYTYMEKKPELPTRDHHFSDYINDLSNIYSPVLINGENYDHQTYSSKTDIDYSKYNINAYALKSQYFPESYRDHHYVHPEYTHVYRRTRRDLYGKLQKLLNALSRDGQSCILKLICEASQMVNKKGSFMEEIIKAVFRIKTHNHVLDEDEYDRAFNRNHNCSEKYKNCPETLIEK